MYLGIDTSNYTTSLALYNGEKVWQWKQLLQVKEGERGLRQSDALFQHTVNLPVLFQMMEKEQAALQAVGVSTQPRAVAGSYMPCFLAGMATAQASASAAHIPQYHTSHQIGHILAALYSVNRLDLITKKFIAFHVSGGTTEALLVTPDAEKLLHAQVIGQSNDLKAGQAVDRVALMLGFPFPGGKALDALSLQSKQDYQVKPSFSGFDFSLSGIENQCRKKLDKGEAKADIAKFCLQSLLSALEHATGLLLEAYGDLPLLYAGGVMSNTLIREGLTAKYHGLFAAPDFSCDNAAGVAIQAYLKDQQVL